MKNTQELLEICQKTIDEVEHARSKGQTKDIKTAVYLDNDHSEMVYLIKMALVEANLMSAKTRNPTAAIIRAALRDFFYSLHTKKDLFDSCSKLSELEPILKSISDHQAVLNAQRDAISVSIREIEESINAKILKGICNDPKALDSKPGDSDEPLEGLNMAIDKIAARFDEQTQMIEAAIKAQISK